MFYITIVFYLISFWSWLSQFHRIGLALMLGSNPFLYVTLKLSTNACTFLTVAHRAANARSHTLIRNHHHSSSLAHSISISLCLSIPPPSNTPMCEYFDALSHRNEMLE